MSATGETKHQVVEATGEFSSDDEVVIKTPSMGGDSLFNILPFEDFAATPIDGVSYTREPQDVVASPDTGGLNKSELPRLGGLLNAHQIIDWIMGRKLMVQEEPGSGESPCESPRISEDSLRDAGEDQVSGQNPSDHDFVDIGDVQDICPACTTPYCQAIDSVPFKSSLKLTYNDAETHTWFVGDKYVMTETIDDETLDAVNVNLVLATDLLRGPARVPVPNVIAGWKENGKIITITEQVQGQRLYDIWWDLQERERRRIAREVVRYMNRWRRFTEDRISSIGGGPVWHHDHLFGTAREGFGPFESDEELWGAIDRRLKEKKVDRRVIQILKDYMPESVPVLTHGDLSCVNILIHNGAVSAILGFDNAACLPAWAEYVAAHFCYTKEDEHWKELLTRRMKRYPWAKDWWLLWKAVENNASDNTRIAALVARCRRWQKPPRRKWFPGADTSEEKRVHEDPPLPSREPEPNPESQLEPPRRYGLRSRKRRDLFRTALSRKLLKGRHYSELLRDPQWELVLHSRTEDSDVEEIYNEEALTRIEKRMEEAERSKTQNSRWVPEERGSWEEEMSEARRITIEKWVAESERGRKAMRPLLEQQVSEEPGATSPLPSPVKIPPWRERQRSFERPNNNSKGLRPFSLPLAQLSEAAKQNLREIDEDKDKNDDDNNNDDGGGGGGGNTQEQQRAEALRSLEGAREGTPAVATTAQLPEDEHAEQKSGTEGKRTSIFRERTAPGSLYLAVASAGAEGRSRRHRRSRSEEQALMADADADADEDKGTSPKRPRPQSSMPRFNEG